MIKKNIKVFKYCFKQMIDLNVYIALIISLLLHTAFYQSSIASYIIHFEGFIPIIFCIIFFNVSDIAQDNDVILFENKAEFSKFKLYCFRYLSCFLMCILFFFINLIEYSILFFDRIDIYITEVSDYVVYDNIGISKVFIAYCISILVFSKIFVFISSILHNKYISFSLILIIFLINLVYKNIPLNILSLYFYGESWAFNKIVWVMLCVSIDIFLYLKNKIKGYVF